MQDSEEGTSEAEASVAAASPVIQAESAPTAVVKEKEEVLTFSQSQKDKVGLI